MDRRDMLRLLATGAALQLSPVRLQALRHARALLLHEVRQSTLDSGHKATVTAMAELIIPRTKTPGATDVGVPDFIDLMVTEWYTDEDRALFLSGLAEVDSRSEKLFGNKFVACTGPQQADILTALGEQMIAEANSLPDDASRDLGKAPEPKKNFYHMFRHLTLTGYYTSEAGATKELGYEIIPGEYNGCADLRSGKQSEEQP